MADKAQIRIQSLSGGTLSISVYDKVFVATSFPTSVDFNYNPLPTDAEDLVSHSAQHSFVNDSVEQLKVTGISNRSVNELNDVDTTSDTPSLSEVLKWNGTNWVPAAYNYEFAFSIASFSDGISDTSQLI